MKGLTTTCPCSNQQWTDRQGGLYPDADTQISNR